MEHTPSSPSESAKSPAPYLLDCHKHGKRPAGIMCKHLNGGAVGKGFYEPDAPPADEISTSDEYVGHQAWCHDCDEYLAANNGDWPSDEVAVDNFTSICDLCFEHVRSLNRLRSVAKA
jgi:hypothetical protein